MEVVYKPREKRFENSEKSVIDACEYAYNCSFNLNEKNLVIYYNCGSLCKSRSICYITVCKYESYFKYMIGHEYFKLSDYKNNLEKLKEDCLNSFRKLNRTNKKINDEDLELYFEELSNDFEFTWDDIILACKHCYDNNIALYIKNEAGIILFPEEYKNWEEMLIDADKRLKDYINELICEIKG